MADPSMSPLPAQSLAGERHVTRQLKSHMPGPWGENRETLTKQRGDAGLRRGGQRKLPGASWRLTGGGRVGREMEVQPAGAAFAKALRCEAAEMLQGWQHQRGQSVEREGSWLGGSRAQVMGAVRSH